VTGRPPYERDVNTVFQDYAIFPHMSVRQNVEYGLRVKKVPKVERRSRAEQALATVRLEGYADRLPHQLSGGQRQRVALARALVNRPKVLLLDEPLGALDLKLRREMQIELKEIQREVGITFVFVTHDQEEALTMSDRIAVFNDGRVVPEEGATGWSDTWMVGADSANSNCAYAWMNHIISPETNAAVAEYFGEAPANAKACDIASEGHCETFHAGDEEYASQIW